MEQKIKEDKIENNLVLCVNRRKTFAIKLIQRSVFRNPSHKNKIRLFSISVFFFFFISVYLRNHDETDCVSEQFHPKKPI